MEKYLDVAICVPAYNEEKNLRNILNALVRQKTNFVKITKIVIVSSGSTDDTDEIGRNYAEKYNHIIFVRQNQRKGKAEAINEFLKICEEKVVVIESADTVPEEETIENLCVQFIKDDKLGMTGGAPHPVNDPNTFLGYIIHVWWWFHRHIPRFGEIIAFRNVLPSISATTAVDEAYIQSKLVKAGWKIKHIDSAVVHNKGPETVEDLIKQRRRILNGHVRLFESQKIKVDSLNIRALKLLWRFKHATPKHTLWFFGGIFLEVYARILGYYDIWFKKYNPFIWDQAKTTKELE